MDASEIKKVLSQFDSVLQKFSKALAHDLAKDELFLDEKSHNFHGRTKVSKD